MKKQQSLISVSYVRMSAMQACEEYFRQQHLVKTDDEEYTPVDTYWSNLGQGIQYVLEKIANNNLNDIVGIQDQMNIELEHLKHCMIDIEDFDVDIHTLPIDFVDAKYLSNYEYKPIDLVKHRVAKLSTIQNRWYKYVVALYPILAYTMQSKWGLENIQSEFPIDISNNGIRFRGSVDFLCKIGKNEYEVVDGKLRYNPEYLHKDQMIGYGYHLRELGYNVTKLTWWDYTNNEFHNVPFSDVDIARYNDRVTSYINKIQSIGKGYKFSRTPNYLCKYCPLDKNICHNSIDEI